MSPCHGLGFTVALPSAALFVLIVTFCSLSVGLSLGWALVDMILLSPDLRKSI